MATITPKQIYGTAQTVINSAVDVAAGNFSATTTVFDNTTDSVIPDAPYGLAVLSVPDFAASPIAGTVASLWELMQDVDGTDDVTQPPSGTASGGARQVGQWIMSADDALQRRAIVISLLGVRKASYYVKNETAQNMNNDAGTNLVVKITPFGEGAVTS